MRLKTNPDVRRLSSQAGFSMTEMLIVIGIIGVLVGYGAVSYVNKLTETRVSTGIQILNANFKQARQSAIAMRQSRRVVISMGQLSGLTDRNPPSLSGQFDEPMQIWIEGKICEEYPFDANAACVGGNRSEPNAYELTDPENFPDGILIADVDGRVPGYGGNPTVICVEFNSRGAIQKVYFAGRESQTLYNEIQPVFHLIRIGEVFNLGTERGDYIDVLGEMNNRKLEWTNPPTEESLERNKVQTVEIIRLTGKTRTYDYAIMNPWPLDEFIKE
ncbi:MAG: pilus assembly FimT family protein [Candidatus Hinthialibacter sp.]